MKTNEAVAQIAAAFAITSLLSSTAAFAADDTEKGLLIGLGITAATGKTTMGADAGAIEAAMLNQESIQQAGAIIAMIANDVAADPTKAKRSVLVLGQTDVLDFSLPLVVKTRLKYIESNLEVACRPPEKPKPQKFDGSNLVGTVDEGGVLALPDDSGPSRFFGGGTARGADLFGAAMVDRSISALTAPTVDQQLVSAVLMNRSQPLGHYTMKRNSWNAWQNPDVAVPATPGADAEQCPKIAANPDLTPYRLLGEPQNIEATDVWKGFTKLQTLIDNCTGREVADKDGAKKWLETASGVLGGLLSTEKGPSPLSIAAQIETIRADPKPLILRVAVDHSGGTAISRTGLLYSLGFPNAATVGAGLVASFRLIDPETSAIERQGVLRCAVDQTNVRQLRPVLRHRTYRKSVAQPRERGSVACDFKVA